MSFQFTTGAVGTVRLYTMTDDTTVGALAIEFDLITGRSPKENTTTGGLYDLELKHVQLTPAFFTWYKAASPYDASGTAAVTVDLDTGTSLGGGTSTSAPTYLMVAAITEDTDSDKVLICSNLVQIEKGSADISTAKGKANEATSKLKGVVPKDDVTVAATKFPSVATGTDTDITPTAPCIYEYFPHS